MDGSITRLCGETAKMSSEKQNISTYPNNCGQADKTTFI